MFTSAAHWALDERRRVSSGFALVVDILVYKEAIRGRGEASSEEKKTDKHLYCYEATATPGRLGQIC